jgi:hypothetical protein
MSHDENGAPPTVYEQVAVLRRSVTLLTNEVARAVAERDEALAEVERWKSAALSAGK